jgi:hypothetical protein
MHLNNFQFRFKENRREVEFTRKREANLIKPIDILSGYHLVFLLPY